jgi:branched-chain amino acid transport system substrate-binding protein
MMRIRFDCQHRKEQVDRQRRPLLPFAFCTLPFAFAFFVSSALCFAQQQTPYAAMNHDAVSYNGPGRDARHDLAGAEIRIGVLLPLKGPRQAEGEALMRGAQMAVDEENATSLPDGQRLTLVARDESGPWGQASSEIVRMVFDDQVVALVTSADGGAAHLAEQVANKIGVPVLTMSTDTTTTEINLPWIFRLGPTDADQAGAFAREIHQARKLERVALLTEGDHDGRAGGDEFEHAARKLNAPAPARILIPPSTLFASQLETELKHAQAVVIWTDQATARQLMVQVRAVLPMAPIYLCRKAAQVLPEQNVAASAFARTYRQRFHIEPGLGAAQAYDAVRLLARALRQSGPNRARLRDALAGLSGFQGASGVITFDHAGNNVSAFK